MGEIHELFALVLSLVSFAVAISSSIVAASPLAGMRSVSFGAGQMGSYANGVGRI